MARASISLPVPVSPVSRIGSGVGAMRRAMRQQLGDLLGGPDALGVAVERLGRPERGALLLVAAVAVEACGRWRPACGWRRRVQRWSRSGARPGEELPGLVAVLAEDGEVLGRCLPDGVERFALAPARADDHPGSGRACRDEGQLRAAPGLVEDRERLAPEDVRMPASSISATALSRFGGVGS